MYAQDACVSADALAVQRGNRDGNDRRPRERARPIRRALPRGGPRVVTHDEVHPAGALPGSSTRRALPVPTMLMPAGAVLARGRHPP